MPLKCHSACVGKRCCSFGWSTQRRISELRTAKPIRPHRIPPHRIPPHRIPPQDGACRYAHTCMRQVREYPKLKWPCCGCRRSRVALCSERARRGAPLCNAKFELALHAASCSRGGSDGAPLRISSSVACSCHKPQRRMRSMSATPTCHTQHAIENAWNMRQAVASTTADNPRRCSAACGTGPFSRPQRKE